MMSVPWSEFVDGVKEVYPNAKFQDIAACIEVLVFDYNWFRYEFWPYWVKVVEEINGKLPARPLENSEVRGICDEINKRFVVELTICTRIATRDRDVGPGVLEASVMIVSGMLNRVPDGRHRTAIVALTKDDGKSVECYFAEPQLNNENFQITALADARNNVALVECWL